MDDQPSFLSTVSANQWLQDPFSYWCVQTAPRDLLIDSWLVTLELSVELGTTCKDIGSGRYP